MAKTLPHNWQPPYPAWSTDYGPGVDTLVIAYYGVQADAASDPAVSRFVQWFRAASRQGDGPDHVERARLRDAQGLFNELFIAYWCSPERYARWHDCAAVRDYWGDPVHLTQPYGLWREVLRVPSRRFETLFSSQTPAGAAVTARSFVGPVREHAYWGSMRDRLPITVEQPDNTLASPLGETLPRSGVGETRGRRVRVHPPENLALIRSAQNWTDCGDAELDFYMRHFHPVLIEGMDYIRDHPFDTGCATCRFAEELTPAGEAQKKTFGMAYFLTLGHLERWSKEHPTHKAIFGAFFRMVQHFQQQIDLKLWHEVSVLPSDGHWMEYVNCHPGTGLLPYFPAEVLTS